MAAPPEFRNPGITPELSRTVLAGSFPGDMGFELLEIAEGRARGRLLVDTRHLHPGGFVHGGIWTSFADTVAAWGTKFHLAERWDFTTVELKTNVFAGAREGDELIATAEPLHLGRRTQVWEVRIAREKRLVALFVCTQLVTEPVPLPDTG